MVIKGKYNAGTSEARLTTISPIIWALYFFKSESKANKGYAQIVNILKK